MSHFRLFRLPAKFRIDKGALKSEWLQLQKKHHPDMDRCLGSGDSAKINSAYATLLNDYSRARYMLKNNHVSLDSTQVDADFLAGIMDRSMQVDEADAPTLERLKTEYSREYNELVDSIANAFDRNDYAGGSLLVAKMGYLLRLERLLADRLDT